MGSWFSQEVEYRGWGRALFGDPAGEFCGKTVVTASAFAGPELRLEVAQRCPVHPPGGWHKFFFCEEEEPRPNHRVWTARDVPNPCTSLEVATPDGTLSNFGAKTCYSVGDGGFEPALPEAPQCLTFQPLRCQFRSSSAAYARYWVLPLVNYLGFDPHHPFTSATKSLERHPLRLFSSSGLITFTYRGKPAFVEAVPEFTELASDILKGRKQAITAVMVGEVSEGDTRVEDIEDILPFRLLFPLMLSTGTPIASPWIEYRDSNGTLTSRYHVGSTEVIARRRNELLEDCYVGRLLDAAVVAEVRLGAAVRSSIARLVESLQDGGRIEQAMSNIVNALDNLYTEFHVSESEPRDVLDSYTRARLDSILSAAANEVSVLSKEMKETGQNEMFAVLRAVSDRIRSAGGKTGCFGARMRRLLEIHGFRDAEVLGSHYADLSIRQWEKEVNDWRNVAVHSTLDPESVHEIQEMWQVLRHMQDIVLRVVLKTLGFTGPYNPICWIRRGSEPVNWVKPTTVPSALGYKRLTEGSCEGDEP